MAANEGFVHMPVEYKGPAESFKHERRAANKSEHSVSVYCLAARQFGEYLESNRLPTDPFYKAHENAVTYRWASS